MWLGMIPHWLSLGIVTFLVFMQTIFGWLKIGVIMFKLQPSKSAQIQVTISNVGSRLSLVCVFLCDNNFDERRNGDYCLAMESIAFEK